jgi:transposase
VIAEESIVQSYLGVDVSKAKLDVALLLPNDKFKSKVFANDRSGHQALVQWLLAQLPGGLQTLHICMESTGSYHEALACALHDQGLAQFCREKRPERWEAPSVGVRTLQALVARLETLQDMRLAECNRRDVAHVSVVESIAGVIAELDAAIAHVKAQIAKTIDDDPDLKRRAQLLDTIPGLGEKSIAQLLAYIGRPERFRNVKAVTAFASLTPLIRQSGTSLDKRRGTHPMGHQELKRALYFPAMVAGRHNPLVATFWNRLKAQGKPGKVIVVACMHKLLAIAYGVLRSGKPFNADHLKPSTA